MSGDCERNSQLRLLIVDNHIVVREGLLALFKAAGDLEVATAGTTEGGLGDEAFRSRRGPVGVGHSE